MSKDAPETQQVDGAGLRFGIVAARYNSSHVDDLLAAVLRSLEAAGVAQEDIETVRVPGAQEVPYVVNMLAYTYEFDCLIALGVIVAGDTQHHDVLARSTAEALLRIGIEAETPVINGILCVESEAQALARCSGQLSRGNEFAAAALHMAELRVSLANRLDEIESARAAEENLGSWNLFKDGDDEDREPWKS